MLRWLSDLTDADFAAVGPKIARLGTLRDFGVDVPDGFAVTTHAFRAFLAENSLESGIDRELASVTDIDDFAATEAASNRLRRLVEQAPLAASFETVLREAYDELCLRHGDVALPVAVRSSAAGEDAAAASFAGQYESYLGIIGAEAVVAAVRQAWSSLFVARALTYRLRQKQHYRDTPMGVGVLRLVQARCAGVAFSADPVSKKRDRFVIEGSWGWGESVVQGTVESDHVEVDRVDGRIIAYRVGEKRVASVFDRIRGGVAEQELPPRALDDHRADRAAVWQTCRYRVGDRAQLAAGDSRFDRPSASYHDNGRRDRGFVAAKVGRARLRGEIRPWYQTEVGRSLTRPLPGNNAGKGGRGNQD